MAMASNPLIQMAISEKTKVNITLGTVVTILFGMVGSVAMFAQDRAEIRAAIEANSTRISNAEMVIMRLADKVDGMDRNGTTRGQPVYPAMDTIRNELQALRSKQDKQEANIEWVVRSLENLQRDRGLVPPPRNGPANRTQ